MVDAVERLVNLALFLADTRRPVTHDDVRSSVAGYPQDQEEPAFRRMFERDKDDLRAAGIAIDYDEENGTYRLDRNATFAAPVDLTAEEASAIRAAGSALLSDPSFPFTEDLRFALSKLSADVAEETSSCSRLADEEPERQGRIVAEATSAATRRKRATFGYTNSLGHSAPHEVEPYGLFLHDGRWYLVGRDTDKDEVRTYAVARMDQFTVNTSAPKTADYDRPGDFDVSRFIRLPFQYGPPAETFEATLLFDASATWRVRPLTGGHGVVEERDGTVLWRVEARSAERLLRFVIENGPGLTVLAPPDLLTRMHEGLSETEALHA